MRHKDIFHSTPAERKAACEYWGKVCRDNAELWWAKQGRTVPPAGTPEYRAMYNAWIDYMRGY